jgi:hypothetical protein
MMPCDNMLAQLFKSFILLKYNIIKFDNEMAPWYLFLEFSLLNYHVFKACSFHMIYILTLQTGLEETNSNRLQPMT